jgi:periplasmic copper chaperone A
MHRLALPILTLAAALVYAAPAYAHVSLQVPNGAAGFSYKAILQVPHGCEGAATTAIKVRIPEGYFNVKPMPKAGWTIETVRGPYEKTYEQHGTQVTGGVTQIIWSGGELPDDFFDEFAFRGTLASDLPEGAVIYFPTVQTCGEAEEAWIDVTGEDGADKPAPALTITPAQSKH